MIDIYFRFSEDYYNKEAMVKFLICTRKIENTFRYLTQLGVDALCTYKQADMLAMFANVQNGEYFTRRCHLVVNLLSLLGDFYMSNIVKHSFHL